MDNYKKAWGKLDKSEKVWVIISLAGGVPSMGMFIVLAIITGDVLAFLLLFGAAMIPFIMLVFPPLWFLREKNK